MIEYRKGLPKRPSRMMPLPLNAKGYPTPWFVETMADGSRDFRVMSAEKRVRAVRRRLCWLCGDKLGRYMTFVAGPMCGINRTTGEPPCHHDCAAYSATACPFMTLPKAQYREANMPDDTKVNQGAITGNPGVSMLWTTESYRPFKTPRGDWLITMGEPSKVEWYAEGKLATRSQVQASIDSRVHFLVDEANREGHAASRALAKYIADFQRFLPEPA